MRATLLAKRNTALIGRRDNTIYAVRSICTSAPSIWLGPCVGPSKLKYFCWYLIVVFTDLCVVLSICLPISLSQYLSTNNTVHLYIQYRFKSTSTPLDIMCACESE